MEKELTELYRFLPLEEGSNFCNIETYLNVNELRLSPYDCFNDPFEGQLPAVELNQEEIKIIEERNIQKAKEYLKINEIVVSDELIKKTVIANPPQDVIQKLYSNSYLVCCFSMVNPENGNAEEHILKRWLLMWAHYASSHTGFLIKFNKSPKVNSIFRELAFPITYTEDRPIWTMKDSLLMTEKNDELPPKAFLDMERKYFFTKSDCWQYENEARIIYHRNKIGVFSDEDDHSISRGHIKFPPNEITSIFMGSSISKENRGKIIETLLKNNMKPNLFQTTISNLKFHLEMEEVDY